MAHRAVVVCVLLAACGSSNSSDPAAAATPDPAIEKNKADDAAKAAAEAKAEEARRADEALKAKLAEADTIAQARIGKHQERLACMGLYFACSPGDDAAVPRKCEKPADYNLTETIGDDDPIRKLPSWTAAKCDKLLPDFNQQKKQAQDKAEREAKIKAAKEEHDTKRYSNHCSGDYSDEGVRAVDHGVEYEMMAYSRSGSSVSARIRITNKGDSPADGLSLGYSQVVTTAGKEFDLAGGGCTPDALNPGQSVTCTLSFSIPKDQEVEGVKVSTLSKWHFAGSLCAKDFVP